MKRLLLAIVGLAACASASAQTTTITASKLQMSGSPVTTGIVTFTPVDKFGIAIVFADASGAQDGPNPFACAITSGAIVGAINATSGATSGACAIPDSALTVPANILYQETVCDTSTGHQNSGKCYTVQTIPGITGSTFALDRYGPPANTTNAQTAQYAQGPATPTSCIAPYLFTNTTTQTLYSCIAGAYVSIAGASGGSGGGTAASATPSTPGIVQLGSKAVTNQLANIASTGQWADIIGIPSFGAAATHGSITTINGVTCGLDAVCTLATGATTFAGLTGSVAVGQLPAIPVSIVSGLGAAATHGFSSTINGVTCSLDGTCNIAVGASSFTGLSGSIALGQLPTIPVGQLSGLGGAATHGPSISINGNNCTLDGSCTVSATPLTVSTGGTANPSQTSLNFNCGSGIVCSVDSSGNETIALSGGTSTGGGGGTTTTVLGNPPTTAYEYPDLENEPSSCPSFSNASSQSSGTNCWTADSIDATGAAGAGIATPTNITFGNMTVGSGTAALETTYGAAGFSVSNDPPQVTSATGSSGSSTITVSSATNIVKGATVTGTGIGSGAAVSSSYTGGTSVPLTVANSGSVSGSVTFTTSFVSNSLYYRHMACAVAPTIPAAITGGTLTITPGTWSQTDNSITLTNFSGVDSTYTLDALQIYVDGVLNFNDNTPTNPGVTNTDTITLTGPTAGGNYAAGSHSITLKLFSSSSSANPSGNPGSSSSGTTLVTSTGSFTLGGGPCTSANNLTEDVWVYVAAGDTPIALEFDPDLFVAPPVVTTTASASSGASSVTLASSAGVYVLAGITGSGIPSGTIVAKGYTAGSTSVPLSTSGGTTVTTTSSLSGTNVTITPTGFQYTISMQCDISGTGGTNAGNWRFWNSYTGTAGSGNSAGGTWQTQSGHTYPCAIASSSAFGAWHHYELHVTVNQVAGTYQYQDFRFDNSYVFQGLGLQFNANPGHGTTPYTNIQHQIDNTSSTPRSGLGNTEWFDKYNVWEWFQ